MHFGWGNVIGLAALMVAITAVLLTLKEQVRGNGERRRSQAAKVFIWRELAPGPKVWPVTVVLRNSSEQPIYDLAIYWDDLREGGPPGLLPGESADVMKRFTGGDSNVVPMACLEFTDAAGVRWRRYEGRGALDQV